jgi:ribosomal protein S27AE
MSLIWKVLTLDLGPYLARLRCWCECGHTDFMTFHPDRLSLRCLDCGRETAGWQVEKAKARVLRFERN